MGDLTWAYLKLVVRSRRPIKNARLGLAQIRRCRTSVEIDSFWSKLDSDSRPVSVGSLDGCQPISPPK